MATERGDGPAVRLAVPEPPGGGTPPGPFAPRRGLGGDPKTGEREVLCDYDPNIFAAFERRRRESLKAGHRDYIFADSRGRPLSQEWLAKRVWYPTLRTIGVSARGQYNTRDTFITLALSAGEDPGWVATVCDTSEQMIFRHYRTWMPNLRRGDGRLLADFLNLGPERGPGRRKPLKRQGGKQWSAGELNPRPKVINRGVYVRSLVYCSRPDDSHGQDASAPARAVFVPDLRASIRAYPDLRRLGPTLRARIGQTLADLSSQSERIVCV